MKNYTWHLFIIAFCLLVVTGLYFRYDAGARLYTDDVIVDEIHKLQSLSRAAAQPPVVNKQFQNQTLQLVTQLEHSLTVAKQASSGQFTTQQLVVAIVIILIFLYLSIILLEVRSVSKQTAKSHSRIKSEIAKTQMTFASIGDAVITTDQYGLIDYMNQSAQELTGHQFNKDQRQPISNIFRVINEDKRLLDNPVEQAIIHERVFRGRHGIFLQQDVSKQLPIIYTVAPIHDSQSNLIGTINVFHDTSDTHQFTQALSWQATHDVLTQLPNRLLLKEKLELSLEKVRETGRMLTIFFIDLDDFKPINDEYGHEQGDKALKIVAQRLLTIIRNNDMVARLGGDEFVITLLSFDHLDEIKKILTRIMSSISQPIPIGDANVVLSASIGVTSYPNDDSDADTLLRHSDQAMYTAKQKGRNQYHFFDVQPNPQMTRKEQQRQCLERALENNEFFLVYQPKVNMRTGKIYGFEALIRRNNPDGSISAPEDFIPLCEDTALILRIGDWVFKEALKELQGWLKAGFKYHLSINIAAKQFQSPYFIEKLDRLLAEHADIPASYIELEVLESAALQDTTKVSEIIIACHERNISIALDDFGSGYASLSYLKQLPANQLKIDKSFVLDMLTNEGDRAIVEGIISLAAIFKCQVVAEGVETGEHGVMLMRLGCDMAQGYGISKPLMPDKVLEWASNWQPDPNWKLWSETSWDISDFPLLIAHSDHFSGINNIIQSVEQYKDGGPLLDLHSYYHCRLGRWYYNIGKSKYQHLYCYQDLEAPHKETHQLAEKILQLCNNGKQAEALSLIPELKQSRDRVLLKLNRLQHQILAQKP